MNEGNEEGWGKDGKRHTFFLTSCVPGLPRCLPHFSPFVSFCWRRGDTESGMPRDFGGGGRGLACAGDAARNLNVTVKSSAFEHTRSFIPLALFLYQLIPKIDGAGNVGAAHIYPLQITIYAPMKLTFTFRIYSTFLHANDKPLIVWWACVFNCLYGSAACGRAFKVLFQNSDPFGKCLFFSVLQWISLLQRLSLHNIWVLM